MAYEVTATGDFGAATGAGTATFPASSPTVQVSLTTTGDGAHEAHGSVTLTLTADTSAAPAWLLGDPSTATAAVRDDDNVAPTGVPTIDDTTPVVGQTLTADPSGIDDVDGLTGATFTWRWLRVAGGTETEVGTEAMYVVVAGDVGATLKVEARFTDDGGTAETVESAATSAVEAALRPRVSVSPVSSPVAEGEGAQFRVTRTGITAGALTVSYSVSESGAMVASDEEGAKSVAFGDGDTERTVTVPTEADTVHEADSTVTLTLTADAAYDLGTAAADVTVEDDDDSPATGSVTVTGTPTEGETLTADTSGLTDADGLDNAAYVYQWVRTPSGGSDADISGATGATYVPVFADAGATLKVKVTVTDDEGHEATFTSAPTSAVAARARPSVTVVSDGDVTEGSPALFTLTRTGDPAQTLDVTYDVTVSGDFGVTPGAGTATFLANSATVQVSVATTGDSTHEAHGSVTVTLTADTGTDPAWVLGDPSTATAAVEDDDDSPAAGSVTVTGTATEGETLTADTSGITDADGLANAAYTYQWVRTPSGGSDADISGATSQTYTPVFLDAGATLKVKVTVTDDEGHEATFESAPTSAVAALPRPSVTVASDGDVTEGSPALFTLTRTGATAQTLDVAWEVTATGDFGVTPGAGTATFLANSATVQVSVATTGDTTDEADGSVTLTLQANPVAYALGTDAAATVTVEDDDEAPLPTVSVAPRKSPVAEGDPAAEFVVTRTGDTTEALRVSIRVSETGEMVSAGNEGGQTRTLPAGQPSAVISVPTVDDGVHEADSVVTVTLEANAAYELGSDATADVTVEDDDNAAPTGTVTVTGTAREGETLTADASNLDDPDGLTNRSFTWQWIRTSGGTATPIGGATTASYTVVAGDVGSTLKVEASFTDDDGTAETVESAETAAVEALPEVTVASDGDVTEGSAAVFTLTRTGDTAQTLNVDYEVTASGDFGVTTGAGTATFLANSATVQVSVATTGDSAHEAHGSVTLTLQARPAAYALGTDDAATAAVEDDDDSPATGSVAVTGTATEGETLTADTSGITDADGLDNAAYVYQWVRTPSGGSDEDISGATSQTYTPVFADAGATLKVKVTVTDDEGHQAIFTSAPTSAVAALPRPSVTVASDGDVTEGSPAVFTLRRTGDTAQTLDVAYTVTATGDFGVTTGAGTATFLANNATVQVSVATTGDSTHEAHGSVTLTLTADTSADPAYLLGDPSTATAAVEDDDDSPATGSVTVTGTATEGETLTADTSGLADADGLDSAAYVYQWVRTPSGGGDADISGATSQTYTPVFADAGATLKVKVTVTDDEGHRATFTSASTSAVAALPRPSVTVVSDGDVTEGSPAVFTLTRTGDMAQTLDMAYDVTTSGDFGITTGAGTATFPANSATVQVSVPTTGDSTHEAHGSVTLTLTADTSADPAYVLGDPSTATAAVEDDDDSPATGSVAVTGTATEGETLTADTSGIADEDGLDNAAYTYQWVRTPSGGSDEDISGATSQTYVPVFADAGATLKVRVTVTDDEGHQAIFTSAPTSAVAALPRPSVTVASAGDVMEGSPAVFTLTRTGATTGTLDVDYEVTATGDFGVTTGAETATFPANSATVQVSVATTGDGAHEAHGSVTVTLTADTSADPAYVLGAPSTATAAVQDDDDSPATGSVAVTGTATEGETLTADTSGLADADGLVSATYTYQWVRTPAGGSDADISGATSETYTPVFLDAGATLKVRVTVTDDEGHEKTFESAATSAVAALPRPSVTVVSDGDVTEGSPALFTLTRTGDTAQTLDVAYEIAATGAFGVTTGASTAIFPANSATVQVSVATTGDGTHEAHGSVTLALQANPIAYALGADDAATAAVRDDDNAAPTGAVTIDDTTPVVGETLTADASGIDDPDGLTNRSFTWQWLRVSGGTEAPISGATTASYTVADADVGATLKARVGFTDDDDTTETVESAETAAVLDDDDSPTTGAVTITGTPTEGETLTADTSGLADADGLASATYVWQWVRTPSGGSDEDISGATSQTYTPVFQDMGATLKVRVTVTDDRGFQVTLTSAPTSAVAALPRPVVTVASDGDVTEGSPVLFTLTRTGATTGTLDVAYTVTASGDFGVTTGAGTATFPANSATVQVSVATTGDGTHEAHGSVTVTLTANPVAWDLGTEREATAAVRDDDNAAPTGAPTIDDTTPVVGQTLRADASSLDDPDGLTSRSFTWRWLRVASGGGDTEVETQVGTGATYTVVAADVGATLKVEASFTDDDGTGETVESAPTSAVAAASRPRVSVAPVASPVEEGEDAQFTVTRTGVTAGALTVNYSVSETGAMVAPGEEGAQSVAFADGDTERTVTVPTEEDAVHEADSTVTLTLTADAAYDLGTASADVTVEDDDAPTVSIGAPAAVAEGGTLRFPVTLNRAGYRDITLDYAVTGGTAEAGDSTDAGGGTLTIPAGDTSAHIELGAVDDTVDEPDEETVEVTISNLRPAGAATPGTATATGTITDNDAAPTVTLVLTPASITENGGVSTVTARLDRPSSEETTVTVSVSPVAPAVMADYMLSSSRRLTVPAGETTSTGEVTITAEDNDADAPDKTVTVSATAQNPQGVTDPRDVPLTIEDDEAPAGLSIDDVSVAEGDSGGTTLQFTVRLTPAASAPVTVSWATADGTAQAGTDYTAGSGSLTFGVGETVKAVSVSVTGDEVDEPDETFTVTLSSASGATIGDATGTGTIKDDDGEPMVTLVLTPASITENGGESTVTARLSHSSSAATTVTVSAAPVSPAVAGDYTLSANRELTIPAGATESEGLVTVTGVNNAVYAPDKAVTVSAVAENAQGVTAPVPVTLTIRDDEGPPTASVSPRDGGESISINEGETLEFVVSLSHPSAEEAEVGYTLTRPAAGDGDVVGSGAAGGTARVVRAMAEDDNGIERGTVTFMPGETRKVVSLETDDERYSPNGEPITITLVQLDTGYVLDTSLPVTVEVTVLDDDRPPPTVSIAIADAESGTVTEGTEGETLEFVVSLSHSSAAEITVDYTLGGMATAGDDYTDRGSGTVTFAPGATSGSITLTIEDDDIAEESETVTVTLSNPRPSGTATLADATVATGTITDNDDPPTVSVVAAKATEVEDASLVFTVTLSRASSRRITVDYTLGGMAKEGDDYEDMGSGTVTFAPGATIGYITLPLMDDDVAEENETVTVTLSNPLPSGAATLHAAATAATGTIIDDDRQIVTVAAETDTVTEGEEAVFVLTRTGDVSGPLTVVLEVSESERGGDMVRVDQEGERPVMFEAGEPMSNKVYVETDDDDIAGPDSQVTVEVLPPGDEGDDSYGVGNPGTATVTVVDAGGASVLAQGRRAGAASLLRRHVQRFSQLTSDVALGRLDGDHRTPAADVNVGDGGVTAKGDVAVALPSGWDGWASVRYSDLGGSADGSVWDVYAGADRLSADGRTAYGALLGYEPGRVTAEGVRLEAEHVQLGLYGAHRLSETLTVDGAVGWGRGKGDLSLVEGPYPVTASYRSERMAVRGDLTGDFGWGGEGLRVEPQIGLLYAEEDLDAFTDDMGGEAPGERLWLARLGLGPKVTWRLEESTTHGKLRVNLDAHNLASDEGRSEEVSASLELGHRWQIDERSTLDLSASVDGLGSGWFSSGSVGLRYELKF